MRRFIAGCKQWWAEDRHRGYLLVGALLFGAFISQGLPYWDVDFTNFFSKIQNRSVLGLIGDLFSPFSPDPQNWGFMDRSVQFLVYKISFLIAGYNSWPYLIFRIVSFGLLAVMFYTWARRLSSSGGKTAALAASIFLLISTGPVASLVWLGDIAVTAEAAFLALTFVIWTEIEKTPLDWQNPFEGDRAQKRWMLKWMGLALLVYLGYKVKADLKLIPAIVAAYILLLRRRQWKIFASPILLMVLLAVPWNLRDDQASSVSARLGGKPDDLDVARRQV